MRDDDGEVQAEGLGRTHPEFRRNMSCFLNLEDIVAGLRIERKKARIKERQDR